MPMPQTAPPAPPAPPQAIVISTAPGGGGGAIATVGAPTLSLSSLRARRTELSRQLNSAASRRSELSSELRRSSGDARAGLQNRITVLDERLVQLEKDISENGRQLVLAGGDATAVAEAAPASFAGGGLPPGNLTAIVIVFTIFVLCPIALSVSRLLWKRGSRIGKAPVRNAESDIRLERVEQGVDAIAIEVERISEGQRFVTQLMTSGDRLGAGAQEPVMVPRGDAIMSGFPVR